MNWTDEPATEKQLLFLSQHNYTPDHALSRIEASMLIRDFREHPEHHPSAHAPPGPVLEPEAYRYHLAVEKCREAAASGKATAEDLAQAIARRQEFWIDTCREVTKMHVASSQVLELYQRQGCRFSAPNRLQVQEILDALDPIMLLWDKDHPELFFQTLELNFPDLLRLF